MKSFTEGSLPKVVLSGVRIDRRDFLFIKGFMKTSSPLPWSDKFSTSLNPLKNLSFAFDQQSELNSQFLLTFFFLLLSYQLICQTCHILALLNFFIFFKFPATYVVS